MNGKKLAAGNYVMSVVSEGKTASILVTIKSGSCAKAFFRDRSEVFYDWDRRVRSLSS
jgi:hypothetical protein